MSGKPEGKVGATPTPVKAGPKPLPMYKTMMAACIATCTAEVCTLPLDTMKVYHI